MPTRGAQDNTTYLFKYFIVIINNCTFTCLSFLPSFSFPPLLLRCQLDWHWKGGLGIPME